MLLSFLKGIGHPSTSSFFDKATRLTAGPLGFRAMSFSSMSVLPAAISQTSLSLFML